MERPHDSQPHPPVRHLHPDHGSNFFNKTLSVSLNCRDLLDSRKWETFTSGENFTRHQIHRHGGRKVNLTVTYNFGNMKAKRHQMKKGSDSDVQMNYGGGMEE